MISNCDILQKHWFATSETFLHKFSNIPSVPEKKYGVADILKVPGPKFRKMNFL